MADVDLRGNVDINIGPANRSLNTLANRFRKLAENSNTTNKTLREQAAAMNALTSAATKEAAALTRVAAAQAKVNEANQRAKLTAARATDVRVGTRNSTAESRGRQELINSRILTEEVRRRNAIESAGDLRAMRNQQMEIRAARERSRIEDRIARQKAQAARASEQAARREQAAAEERYQGLISMRYAMYDVARTMGTIGIALGVGAVAPAAVAISWEREFANVQRTIEVADEELAALKASFVDLAQTMPINWEELTQIGSLAGQLGIGQEYLANFTENVAKLAAITDISIEDAATAFGRINSLIPDVQYNFDGVADAIAHVGNNSIATESQIVKIVTQVSALATSANFGYQELIGLASALASVGVPPELSRGITTRVIGQLNRAITDGGVALERWGRIAGMTGEQFATAWREDGAGTFLRFMDGIREKGHGAEAALRELGITSVRDVPVLIRLANAMDTTGRAGGLLAEQMGLAADSAGAMDREFSVIADTVSAKLQVLQNNIAAFLDAAGQGSLGPIGAALDIISGKLRDLTDFASGDVGSNLLLIGTAIAGVASALLLLGSVGAIGLAGYAAIVTVFYQMQVAAGGATLSIASMNAMLAKTGPAGKTAALALRGVALAMRVLSGVGAAAAFTAFIPDIIRFANGLAGVSTSLEEITHNIENMDIDKISRDLLNADSTFGLIRDSALKTTVEINRMFDQDGFEGLNNLAKDWNTSAQAVKSYDTALRDMVRSGNAEQAMEAISAIAQGAWIEGINLDEVKESFSGLFAELESGDITVKQLKDGTLEFGGAIDSIIPAVQELTEAEEEAAQAHADFLGGISEAHAGWFDLASTYDSMISKQKELAQATADDTADMSDSWRDYFDGAEVDVEGFLASLQKQYEDHLAWEENLAALAGKIPDAMLLELASMGPEAAPMLETFRAMTEEQLDQAVFLWGQKGDEMGMALADELLAKAEIARQVAARYGQDVADEVIAAIEAGELSLSEAINQYGVIVGGLELPEVELPIGLNTRPAEQDFESHEAYVAALELWTTLRAKTAPAREDFDNAGAYAEAMEIYLTGLGDAAPARGEFESAKEYGDRLIAIMSGKADVVSARRSLAHAKQYGDRLKSTIRANAATGDAERALNKAARNRYATIYVSPVSSRSLANMSLPKGMATGGPVIGPGTATSDSILARLSDGEHVLTAREVAAMGGHSAVLEFRRQLMASRGYATGGEVTPNRSQMTVGSAVTYVTHSAGQQGPIELSPIDRMLLRRAGDLVLKLGNRTVAKAVNNHNVRENNRGAY